MSLIRHSGPPDDRCHTTITGHPHIPPAALPHLRHWLPRPPGTSIRWHDYWGAEWNATIDLHLAGDDEAATQLAVFLRWCQDNRMPIRTVWELQP